VVKFIAVSDRHVPGTPRVRVEVGDSDGLLVFVRGIEPGLADALTQALSAYESWHEVPLRYAEAARLLGVSERSLRRWVALGRIPFHRAAGARIVTFLRRDIEIARMSMHRGQHLQKQLLAEGYDPGTQGWQARQLAAPVEQSR
jgi:excisionase family DNA binding protein